MSHCRKQPAPGNWRDHRVCVRGAGPAPLEALPRLPSLGLGDGVCRRRRPPAGSVVRRIRVRPALRRRSRRAGVVGGAGDGACRCVRAGAGTAGGGACAGGIARRPRLPRRCARPGLCRRGAGVCQPAGAGSVASLGGRVARRPARPRPRPAGPAPSPAVPTGGGACRRGRPEKNCKKT